MSFDLGVWYSPQSLSDAEAGECFAAFRSDGGVTCRVAGNERLAEFVDALTSRYPQIDDLADDQIDACPWNVPFDVSEAHVTIPIMWSRMTEIAPVVMELAERHGLVCYDPQSRKVHLPPGLRPER